MLDVADLVVGYGAASAVADVSLRVAAGELACVVGPNGAGKSTLINAIGGLHRAQSGRIAMDDDDLSRAPAHRYCAAGIAIVPEGRRLFTRMTVLENLELGSFRREARRHRAASLERVCTLFPAVRDKLDAPAGTLSGGQQQMVAIGRALMARPRLLLLDEPSLGLAPAIVIALFDAIREINAAGTAVLLVEQNVVMALEVATHAWLLEEGRIVAAGEPRELFARPEMRRVYLGIAPPT